MTSINVKVPWETSVCYSDVNKYFFVLIKNKVQHMYAVSVHHECCAVKL